MKVRRLFLLTAAAAAPAQGDVTATYSSAFGAHNSQLKVEAADNGDLRMFDSQLTYMIRRNGRTYFMARDGGRPIVADLEEMISIMAEEISGRDPRYCDRAKTALPSAKLVSRGVATVAGRQGEAYADISSSTAPPELVISRDPALAPVGPAIAAQFRLSSLILTGCPSGVPPFAPIQALLDSGTALAFREMKLENVENRKIDPTHFVLPAVPLTRTRLRAMMLGGKWLSLPVGTSHATKGPPPAP